MTDDRIPCDSDTVVRRDIELATDADTLWDLVGDGTRWREWLVDEGTVDVVAGATGEVVDDGEARTVRVDHVAPGRAVEWTWWPTDRPDLASRVAVRLDDGEDGHSVLRVVEVLPAPTAGASARATVAWEVRAMGAWSCVSALALARA